jgi:hypothetical protein
MPYNSKSILKDSSQLQPVPQYFNKDTDSFEVVEGKNGGANVNVVGSKNLNHGLVTVDTAGIKVQLPNVPCIEVTVIARKENTGSIFAGGPSVSATSFGVELEAKESYTFKVSNVNLIYIDSSVGGEGISYVAV